MSKPVVYRCKDCPKAVIGPSTKRPPGWTKLRCSPCQVAAIKSKKNRGEFEIESRKGPKDGGQTSPYRPTL